jgi:hypothetical protein
MALFIRCWKQKTRKRKRSYKILQTPPDIAKMERASVKHRKHGHKVRIKAEREKTTSGEQEINCEV